MNTDFVFSSQIGGGPRGLVNIQSTCYLNSVIQCLFSCDIWNEFLCGDKLEIFISSTSKYQGRVCRGLRDVFKELRNTQSKDPYLPETFLVCMTCSERSGVANASGLNHIWNIECFKGIASASACWSAFEPGRQMDAAEFLSFLLAALHDDLMMRPEEPNVALIGDPANDAVAAWEKSSQSAVSHVFNVQVIGLNVCCKCYYGSGQFGDVNNYISIEVPSDKTVSLEDCLQHYFGEEELADAKCSSCSSKGLRHKLILGRLPPMLIIHLKRWYAFNDTQVSSSTSRHLCTSNAYLLFFEKDPDDNNNNAPFDLPQASLDAFLKSFATPDFILNVDQVTDKLDVSLDLFNEEEEEEEELPPDFDEYMCTNHGDSDGKFDEEVASNHLSLDGHSSEPISENNENFPGASQTSVGGVTDTMTSIVISQCNHLNFDLDIMDPILTEDDVPGAKLDLDSLGKYSVEQLKWWLACRGLVQGGRKPELIQRILNHRHRAGKIYPGVGKGKWYEAKRNKTMAEAYDSNKRYPMLPTGAVWKSFPSVHIPNKYSTDMAINYLKAIPLWRFPLDHGVTAVNQEAGDSDCEDDLFDLSPPTQDQRKNLFVNGTMKRATNFLDSGRVLTVHDCEKDKHYCVKAEVQASMLRQVYVVIIMISKAQGAICFAECCCKARALGRFCRIFAVLLLISRHIERHGNEAVTSTGRRCYWLLPGTSVTKAPGVVRDKAEYYPNVQYYRRGHFDPRPIAVQTDESGERIRDLVEPLSKLSVPVLWSYHLIHPPQSTQEEEMFPDVSTTLHVAEMCSYLLWNLNLIRLISLHQPLHFPLTRHQSLSPFWHFERAIRISASKAKTFLGLVSSRSTTSGKINTLRKHIWGLDAFQNQAMKEGLDKEPDARKAYITEMKKEHPEWDVIETGMWVNPKYPQLSCSPDGIIVNVSGFVKLLEVKCPAVLKGIDPADFETLPKEQLRAFCLTKNKTTGTVELRRTHAWYYQVQMSLDIMQLKECDFVVFSEKNNQPRILTNTIQYDEAFWREKRERLERIHRELIVPEFFLFNTVFKRPPSFLVYTPFHEECDDMYFWHGENPVNNFTFENESEVLIDY